MKFLMFTVLLFPICAGGLSPQNGRPTKPAPRKFKHNSKVESTYDRTGDITTTYLRPMTLRYVKSSIEAKNMSDGRIDYMPQEMLSMTAYFKSGGKVPVKPQFVVIGFRSMALDKTLFTNNRSLTARLNDSMVILVLGTMNITEHRNDDRLDGPVRYIIESLELPIPYETFKQITNAKEVSLNVGGLELALSNDHLEAFRDLISRVD